MKEENEEGRCCGSGGRGRGGGEEEHTWSVMCGGKQGGRQRQGDHMFRFAIRKISVRTIFFFYI